MVVPMSMGSYETPSFFLAFLASYVKRFESILDLALKFRKLESSLRKATC